MRDKEWLNSLKAGDSVVVESGTYGKSLAKVERTTPTQIVLGSSAKYWKKNGNRVGNQEWLIESITKPTDALLNEIRKRYLCDQLRKVVWEKISVSVLADIFEKAKNGQHLK